MVSLTRHLTINTSGSGAVFFDSPANMDDEEYLQPVLTSEERDKFKKVETIPIVAISLIFCVALEISGIIFVSLWPEQVDKCETYFILLYIHCAFWLVIMITDHFVKRRHHQLRISGYLDFYHSTYQHIRTPFYIVSLWNTIYLFLTVFIHQTHKVDYEKYCKSSELFTPLNYILIFTTVEIFIIIPVYINYIKRVYRFNHMKPLPDVLQEDWLNNLSRDSYAEESEVGYRQRGYIITEVFEKQADMIRYLKDHNEKLSHRLMLLSSQRRATQS